MDGCTLVVSSTSQSQCLHVSCVSFRITWNFQGARASRAQQMTSGELWSSLLTLVLSNLHWVKLPLDNSLYTNSQVQWVGVGKSWKFKRRGQSSLPRSMLHMGRYLPLTHFAWKYWDLVISDQLGYSTYSSCSWINFIDQINDVRGVGLTTDYDRVDIYYHGSLYQLFPVYT